MKLLGKVCTCRQQKCCTAPNLEFPYSASESSYQITYLLHTKTPLYVESMSSSMLQIVSVVRNQSINQQRLPRSCHLVNSSPCQRGVTGGFFGLFHLCLAWPWAVVAYICNYTRSIGRSAAKAGVQDKKGMLHRLGARTRGCRVARPIHM